MLFANPNREVSEWLKELAWKASIWVTVSWVRIPSSLQKQTLVKFYSQGFCFLNVKQGFTLNQFFQS